MRFSTRRTRQTAIRSWLLSAILHLAVALVAAVVFVPAARTLHRSLAIAAQFAEPSGELPLWLSVVPSTPIASEPATLRLPPSGIMVCDGPRIADPWTVASDAAGDQVGDGAVGSEAQLQPAERGPVRQASFFGTQALGNDFVYILDVSPSMKARSGQRLARALDELLRSIEQLHQDQRFFVIVFGWVARPMLDERASPPSTVAATDENKRRLRQWLDGVRTIEGTDPRPALRIGLSMKPDAIFLLSDGEFNQPPKSFVAVAALPRQKVTELVRAGPPIPIHTIAFEDRISEAGMRKIADLTQGIHRFVPAPESRARRNRHERQARLWLDRGLEQRDARQFDKARDSFQHVVTQFPDSEAFSVAAQQLESLDQREGVR